MSSTPRQPSQAERIKRLEDRLRRLETRRSLGLSSIAADGLEIESGGKITVHPGGKIEITGGDIDVTSGDINLVGGDLNLVGGDITASGGSVESGGFVHGAAGWRLQPGGNAEFNDITLRGGIIGNDALANPVSGGRCDGTQSGITLPLSRTILHSEDITVPAGFTRALVLASVAVGGLNNCGSDSVVVSAARIEGVNGDDIVEGVADSKTGHSFASFTRDITGLSGGSVTVSALGYTGIAGWTGATARVSGIAIFLR